MCAGRPVQALQLLEKALRLDPVAYHADYQFDLAMVHLSMGKRDQAIDELRQVLIHQPDFYIANGVLAVIYADTGRENEARAEAAKWLKLVKPLTIPQIRELVRQNNACADQVAQKHDLDTLERLTAGVAQSG